MSSSSSPLTNRAARAAVHEGRLAIDAWSPLARANEPNVRNALNRTGNRNDHGNDGTNHGPTPSKALPTPTDIIPHCKMINAFASTRKHMEIIDVQTCFLN